MDPFCWKHSPRSSLLFNVLALHSHFRSQFIPHSQEKHFGAPSYRTCHPARLNLLQISWMWRGMCKAGEGREWGKERDLWIHEAAGANVLLLKSTVQEVGGTIGNFKKPFSMGWMMCRNSKEALELKNQQQRMINDPARSSTVMIDGPWHRVRC